ncbi:MAG: hypothetical protein WDM92_03380 [Caulobacteraceae bacterium]
MPGRLQLLQRRALSASCANYLQIHPTNLYRLSQDVAELNLQGGVYDLPAGELRLALGASYRQNTYSYTPDPAATDEVGSFPAQSSGGATRVKEFYGEALVPVGEGPAAGQGVQPRPRLPLLRL